MPNLIKNAYFGVKGCVNNTGIIKLHFMVEVIGNSTLY